MAAIFKSHVWVLVLLLSALLAMQQIQKAEAQTCSNQLSNLNVCAPFVLPGASNPSAECCVALRGVPQDCLCSTLRIASRLPSECNLPSPSCGAN